MAMKLVDIRLSVFGEITNQLQLPVDENEASNLVRRLSFESNIDSSAAFAQWAETIHSINSVDLSKFVFKVRKKVKDAHDLTRRWQKEYKDLKGKMVVNTFEFDFGILLLIEWLVHRQTNMAVLQQNHTKRLRFESKTSIRFCPPITNN